MDLPTGDKGPVKLLFVGRGNLATIVREIAPELMLVDRRTFESIATAMLTVVETAVAGGPVLEQPHKQTEDG